MTGLLRLALAGTREELERGETVLCGCEPAPLSTALYEDGTGWMLEALYDGAPERDDIVKLLAEALGRTPQFDLAPLPDKDWIAQSLAGLAPIRAGRFFVHGRHDRGTVPAGAIALEIEAGAAFGTGHHATTLGCLLALGDIAKTRRCPRVLDIGTGTGVLAIAAAKLWRQRVTASDIDPVAVEVARENAAGNGVTSLIRIHQADGLRHREIVRAGPFALVLANILAGPLVRLAGPVAAIVLQRSKIVLSGLLDEQSMPLIAQWRGHGFVLVRRLSIGGWTTLVLEQRRWRKRRAPRQNDRAAPTRRSPS